jgi:hypothetical protein
LSYTGEEESGKFERMLLCFGSLQKKSSLKFGDFGACCLQESFCMNHTESLFVGKSRISQKEKKHWL